MAQRKVKNGEKSPWGQCLTRPVPNGRRHSGFWLVPENLCFSKTMQNMAQVKEPGGGGEERKRLQTNPRILKTTHLACHAWICTTFDAVISCQNWPIKYLVEQKQTLEDACVKTEIIFFRILKCMDGVNVEISMNLNNQCRLCTFVFLIRVKGRTAGMKFWSLRTKPPERWILKELCHGSPVHFV